MPVPPLATASAVAAAEIVPVAYVPDRDHRHVDPEFVHATLGANTYGLSASRLTPVSDGRRGDVALLGGGSGLGGPRPHLQRDLVLVARAHLGLQFGLRSGRFLPALSRNRPTLARASQLHPLGVAGVARGGGVDHRGPVLGVHRAGGGPKLALQIRGGLLDAVELGAGLGVETVEPWLSSAIRPRSRLCRSRKLA